MYNLSDHTISSKSTIKDAMSIIDEQGVIVNVLFIVDDNNKLVGTITDGDIRRGLLKGAGINDPVTAVMQSQYKYLHPGNITHQSVNLLKEEGIFFVPVIDENYFILNILNLHQYRVNLPLDAVIMAGGKGQRLMPLTKDVPKPMLHIGDKPIIEHSIERLRKFGIDNLYISVNYLKDNIVNHFQDGKKHGLNINYIHEDQPMGTLGSITLVPEFTHDYILIMNSDILTNIDIADFFLSFSESGADMAVAATSYHVDIPYAVLEVDGNNKVASLKEKPRYTYYSNAGIYLVKKEVLSLIPKDAFFNVTDLMELLIQQNKCLITYPITGYWLDIGKHEDFAQAQKDINHIKF